MMMPCYTTSFPNCNGGTLRRYIVLIALLLALLSACGRKDSEAAPKGGRRDDSQSVMVEELSLRDIDEYVNVSGKLEGITDIVMSAESSGRILELYKKLGDYVEKGERIGRLENEILQIRLQQAEAAYNAAETGLQNAQRNLDYATQAREQELISEAEYSASNSAFKGAKAAFDGTKAGLESARLAYDNSYLLAAEKGRISQLHIASGQYINMGMPIASITDASTLILKTGVGESQIGKLKAGQSAVISHSGKEYRASVRGFGIRPVTGGVNYPLELTVSGGSGLLPGMVVSARIKTNTFKKLLYTSITNVQKEFDRDYVYVAHIDGDKTVAVQRDVLLGRSVSEFVEILSGLEAGEKIVVSGTENLENGSLVKIRN